MHHWFPMLCTRPPLSDRQAGRLAAFLRLKAGRASMLKPALIARAAAYINQHEPAMQRRVLADAGETLRLRVKLFGHTFNLKAIAARHGRPGRCGLIPWFHELHKGIPFYPDPVTFAIKAGPNDTGYDKKHMLDLPRLQWATCLGEAYALTGNEQYTRMFTAILEDFFTHVPPGAGFPWANAMDNGIRAANMLLMWSFFHASPMLCDRFVIRFWQSMVEHVRACLHHDEAWPIDPPHPMAELPHIRAIRRKNGQYRLYGNHFLGGRLGVWAVLNALPPTPELKDLHAMVQAEMEREILAETLADGMNFEASTHYHRLVTEMFFCWAMVCRNRRVPMSDRALARLRKQFEFGRDITKPDGRVPQVGDMDNGRIHIFGYDDWRDHRYLTQLGACLFKNRSLLAPGTSLSRYALWHFGPVAARFTDPGNKAVLRPAVYPESGAAVLRSGPAYAAFFALKNGQDGAGGHSHEDKLGIEYSLGNKNILADPGQGVYMSDMPKRVFFRSALNHSVLTVDDEPINPICPGYPWFVPDNARAEIIKADLKRNRVAGRHFGLKPCGRKGYTRTVTLDTEGRLTIHDKVPGSGTHLLTWRFVLAPEMRAAVRGKDNRIDIRNRDGVCAVLSYPAGMQFKVTIAKGLYAPEYGIDVPTRVITLSTRRRLPQEVEFVIGEE